MTITPNTGTINAPTTCGGTGTNAASQTVTSTCSPNISTSDNGATVTFNATANTGSVFGGWSNAANMSPNSCTGTTNPCSGVFGGGGNGALTVTFTGDTIKPDVTINQASGQADPTNASPINFTAAFSEPINTSSFTSTDVSITGTAGGTKTVTITNPSSDGKTFNIAVGGMTNGTVIASIPAGGVNDVAGNSNNASTSTDNSVTYDNTKPSVTINQAAAQVDPTNASPINFTVVFSESVTGFAGSDVSLSGTAGATTATVTGGPTTYNVAVSGMTSDGTVIATVSAGGASDSAGNTNNASTSTDNTVTYDATKPSVTVNQASGQADPTNTQPINFTAVFSEPINPATFTSGDVTIGGTAPAARRRSPSPIRAPTTRPSTSRSRVPRATVRQIASIGAGVVSDLAGNTEQRIDLDRQHGHLRHDEAERHGESGGRSG